MNLKFLKIETSVKSKANHIYSTLTQRRCRKEPVMKFDDECIEEEQDASTQFLQTQKNQLIDIATFFLSLASTAQNTTSIQSRVFCYLSSLMNEESNQKW